jgi:hypothetical protein
MPPKEQEPEDEDKVNKLAQHKNAQAWDGLRKFSQPVIVAAGVGRLVLEISCKFVPPEYNNLIAPALTFPLVGVAVASCVNISENDFRNYIYYSLIGCIASISVIVAPSTQYFFHELNHGWLKDVFTTTLLHPQHGIGFSTMVVFHSLYLFLQKKIFKFAFSL